MFGTLFIFSLFSWRFTIILSQNIKRPFYVELSYEISNSMIYSSFFFDSFSIDYRVRSNQTKHNYANNIHWRINAKQYQVLNRFYSIFVYSFYFLDYLDKVKLLKFSLFYCRCVCFNRSEPNSVSLFYENWNTV